METGERIALWTILLLFFALVLLLVTGCAPVAAAWQTAGRTVTGMWSVMGGLAAAMLAGGAVLLALRLMLR